MPEKSYLVQKFARLPIEDMHLVGYSVAGEETVVQVPELDVCFDIGRCPYFALTSNYLCLTHGHMDHMAGLAYYFSQRYFRGMRQGAVLIPAELEKSVCKMLDAWGEIEKTHRDYQYRLVGMVPGRDHFVRKDLAIRALEAHHRGGMCLAYSVIGIRHKLKPEFVGLSGPELVALKNRDIAIQQRTEVPLITFLGDTAMGEVFWAPEVTQAKVLVTECTFFEDDQRRRAYAGKHLYVDELVSVLERVTGPQVVLTHVTSRTGVRRAKGILRSKLSPQAFERVRFLMDFEGASDGGGIDQLLPPEPDEPLA